MKNFKVIAFASVMLALTGCFAEDYTYCPPEDFDNVTLSFRLPEETRADSFYDRITSSVVTVIYNEEGQLVQQHTTTNDHHRDFQGIKTKLPVGTYRVVSWGNVGENPTYSNLDRHYFDDGLFAQFTYSHIDDGRVSHGDELFYAPNTVVNGTRMGAGEGNADGEYIMTVSEKGHEGTLDFCHAHRHVEIYVKNYNDGEGGSTPIVRLNGLPHGLSAVGMKHIPESEGGQAGSAELPCEMVEIGKDGEEGWFALAAFNTFHFRMNCDNGDDEYYEYGNITVDIINPLTGEMSCDTVNMNEHIEEDNDVSKPLRLLVEFLGDLGIQVTIPNWKLEGVGYETR